MLTTLIYSILSFISFGQFIFSGDYESGLRLAYSGVYTWNYSNGNGCPSADTLHLNITAEHDYYWIGGVSSAWEEQANLSCGLVPNEQSKVYVQEVAQRDLEVKPMTF